MRTAVVGAGVLASLAAAAFVASLVPSVGFAQRAAHGPVGSTGGLIALEAPVGDKRQQVTVIDPQTHVLSVYHIDLVTGAVTLKSVRNIHWDLQLIEHNGTSPLPQDVRAMVEQ